MSKSLRFRGFALLINTALPFVLGLALILLLSAVIDRLRSDFSGPVQQISADISTAVTHAQQSAQQIATAAQAVQSDLNDANIAMQGLIAPLQDFNITLPPLAIAVPTGVTCDPLKLPVSYKGHTAPPQARMYQAQGVFDGIVDGAGKVIDDAGRLLQPTLPANPAPVLRRPAVPGLNPTVSPQPVCQIATTSIDVAARLAAPINAGLKEAFAVPRDRIQTINASITNASARMKSVVAQMQRFPLRPTDVRAHGAALAEASTTFFLELADLLQIALWICIALLIWAVVSLAGWLLARILLGWHLMRHGTYP